MTTGSNQPAITEATNGITQGVEVRRQRGLEIAALARIELKDGLYVVPSQTNAVPTRYKVNAGLGKWTCNCADHETRRCKCKHIYAVEFFMKRERHADGSETITESVTVSTTRQTYAQDWPNYNAAQVNEKRHFQKLLNDLCEGIVQPPQDMSKGGRPRLSLADAVFASVAKVYSTISARRFTNDLREACDNGYIDKVPHFNTIFKAMENPTLYPILLDLIQQAALPLKAVETQFAVDSTGFAFSRFVRWYDIKYNRFTSEQQWVKAHLMCGTKTNVITAVEIHGRDAADALQLPSLVATTAKKFDVREVSADKGYSSRDCHDAIAAVGATPYIAFKGNATGDVGGLFGKMFHYFKFKREDFLAHYHRRSNIESTVMMVKTKFGDSLRSKCEVAARNEVLCKVLCHNICCLISAMYELGITPVLGVA